MKSCLKKLSLGVLLAGFLAAPAFAQTKIGTVSLAKVFDGYWKTKQADANLKDRQADMKKSETEMADSWKKANEEYQKLVASAGDPVVSSEEREKRSKEAQGKLKELKDIEANAQQFQRQAGAMLQEQKARMTKNLIDEIKLAITGKAKAGGFTIVLDSDALLFSNGENDLTESVLAQLNAGAPDALAKEIPAATTPKPDPKKPGAK